MRPSNLQSRLIDTYGALCDETGLNRLPFAEARRLSIDTLRDLIAWRQHTKKHADNDCPPPYTGEPAGGWDAFVKRGPVAEVNTAREEREPTVRTPCPRRGLTFRQQAGRLRQLRELKGESIVDDYLNQ